MPPTSSTPSSPSSPTSPSTIRTTSATPSLKSPARRPASSDPTARSSPSPSTPRPTRPSAKPTQPSASAPSAPQASSPTSRPALLIQRKHRVPHVPILERGLPSRHNNSLATATPSSLTANPSKSIPPSPANTSSAT